MAQEMPGGCACGRVRYVVAAADDDAYLCHCRMCQRTTGSVSIAQPVMLRPSNIGSDAVAGGRPGAFAPGAAGDRT